MIGPRLIVVILFQLKPPNFDPKLLSTLENASLECLVLEGGGRGSFLGIFKRKEDCVTHHFKSLESL